jgi:aspartate/methionine/tyrosine aminotransferase
MREANRLNSVSEYYFSKKLKEVKGLITEGKPIINMGIGSPDLDPPTEVTDTLIHTLAEPGVHGYQSYIGREELRAGFADFYHNHYGVSLNTDTEILPLMGSKEGIMHISMAFVNPGDKVLIPNPGYPTYTSVTELVGGKAVFYRLTPEGLPDFDHIDARDLKEAVMMWVNYPHMQTFKSITKDKWAVLAQKAQESDLLLINDNPYSFIGNEHPTSILSQKGKYGPLLELNSLSKVVNMAGWRVGSIQGDAGLIQSVLKVKSNMDSGMFMGIQRAAVAALAQPKEWFAQLNKVYDQRRAKMEELCQLLGLVPDPNQVGMFVWCRIPENTKAEELVEKYLSEYHFFIAPGTIFGSEGSGYVRFSLCIEIDRIEEVIKRINKAS